MLSHIIAYYHMLLHVTIYYHVVWHIITSYHILPHSIAYYESLSHIITYSYILSQIFENECFSKDVPQKSRNSFDIQCTSNDFHWRMAESGASGRKELGIGQRINALASSPTWFHSSQRLNALPVHLLSQVYRSGLSLQRELKNRLFATITTYYYLSTKWR